LEYYKTNEQKQILNQATTKQQQKQNKNKTKVKKKAKTRTPPFIDCFVMANCTATAWR
jgi:hypothetical protein